MSLRFTFVFIIFHDFCRYIHIYNCLVGVVVLSATATLEVLGSIPRPSKKCDWVFL